MTKCALRFIYTSTTVTKITSQTRYLQNSRRRVLHHFRQGVTPIVSHSPAEPVEIRFELSVQSSEVQRASETAPPETTRSGGLEFEI